jgi:insulysin
MISTIPGCLEKPSLDDRSYRVARLPNDIEALLIHNLDRKLRSLSDPADAHSIEHLLFMGTNEVWIFLLLSSGLPNSCR